MKRLAVISALAAAAALSASTTSVSTILAASPTIEDFVADCADGTVHIAGTQRYRGGSAVLGDVCVVIPEPGATLVIRDAELTGAGALVVTTGPVSGADVTIKIVDTNISLDVVVELAAGAAAGDELVPEQNGTVVIRNSVVSGSAVIVAASFDWPDGRIAIRSSTVTATTGNLSVGASELNGTDGVIRISDSTLSAPTGDISVRTGTDFPSGDRGKLRIVDSTVDAGGSTLIDSGRNGRTIVRTSSITGTPVTITTGPGGSCSTVALTPPTPCS